MPINKSQVTKILKLDLTGIPSDSRADALQEVADYLKEQVLDDLGGARSPVTGRAFKPLSSRYAARKGEVSSAVIPNMELTGAMLDALEVRAEGNRLEIGWFDEEQTPKAFNHTTGDTVPKRPLIPAPKEDFRSGIRDGIESILDEFRESNGKS